MKLDIEKLLKEAEEINGYKVRCERTESFEIFFVHKSLETVRSTDTVNTDVTVYVDHDGKKGDASFKIYASTEEDEAREKIGEAAKKAACIDNQFYTLPAAEKLEGKIESNFEDYKPTELAKLIADTVLEASDFECGGVNALEVFINKHTVTVKNSNGVDKKEIKYSAMVEAIPTWNGKESVELYECKRFSSLDIEDLKAEIDEKMQEVRDRGSATPPASPLNCSVVLGAHELLELFSDIAHNLNFSSVYTHSNLFSVGDEVQKNARGDKISIEMKGAIKGSCNSAIFDGDGVTLKDTEIVKDGKAVSYFGSDRFAQYLEMPVTGNLRCISVKKGTLTDKELASKPYFKCVSMSGIQIDAYNDYIGGEVRLAYYYDGEKTVPVTGISISGKLSEALASVRLSDSEACFGGYAGPKLALFEGIAII